MYQRHILPPPGWSLLDHTWAGITKVTYLKSITSKHYNNTVSFQLTIITLPKNPFSPPGLPSRVQPMLRQPKWLTLRVLPLSIIITLLPIHLLLQLCPKALSKFWACPQECNQYPGAETIKVAYLNNSTSKYYNNTIPFQLTITTLPKNPF